MKKILSVILAMMMLFSACVWAEEEEDWYLARAAELIEDMKEISADEAYIEMMGGSEEIRALIAEWNQAMQNEPVSIRKGSIPMAQLMGPAAAAMGVGEVGVKMVERNSISMGVNVLIGQQGTNFLAASATVQIGEGYVMPEEFEACVVVYAYEEIAVAVSFKEAGEGVVLAQAQFCPIMILDNLATDEAEGGAQINEALKDLFGK